MSKKKHFSFFSKAKVPFPFADFYHVKEISGITFSSGGSAPDFPVDRTGKAENFRPDK